MADVVRSGVNPSSGAAYFAGIAGGTIVAGDPVYLDTATNTLKQGDADTLATSQIVGIAAHGAASGQPLHAQNGGNMVYGGLTQGVPYFVSTTAGSICPIADLLSGDFPTFVGIAISSTVLKLGILSAGVAI